MPFEDYTPTSTQLVTLSEADDDEPLEASTTNVSLEQLADGIVYVDNIASAALPLAGGTMTGGLTLDDSAGALVAPSGAVITAQFGSLVTVAKTRIWAPESLSDADHSLDINSNKNRIIMRTPPAANRDLTLLKASASPAPVVGDWFEITVLLSNSAYAVLLRREGFTGGDSIGIIGDGVGVSPYALSGLTGTILVVYDGSNWRFAAAGGVAFFGVDA